MLCHIHSSLRPKNWCLILLFYLFNSFIMYWEHQNVDRHHSWVQTEGSWTLYPSETLSWAVPHSRLCNQHSNSWAIQFCIKLLHYILQAPQIPHPTHCQHHELLYHLHVISYQTKVYIFLPLWNLQLTQKFLPRCLQNAKFSNCQPYPQRLQMTQGIHHKKNVSTITQWHMLCH